MRTTSLEISKQLDEAGFPQLGTYFYQQISYSDIYELRNNYTSDNIDWRRFYSPTADEVLDQLPTNSSCNKGSSVWVVKYWWGKHPDPLREAEITTHWHAEKDKSLADAAAKMWLYLKKEGLL